VVLLIVPKPVNAEAGLKVVALGGDITEIVHVLGAGSRLVDPKQLLAASLPLNQRCIRRKLEFSHAVIIPGQASRARNHSWVLVGLVSITLNG
jgi:hypothetical protein